VAWSAAADHHRGRKPVIGRPILYKTTKEFLLRFGLKDVNDLPSMEEFEKMAGELAESEAEGEAQDAVNLSSEAPTPAEAVPPDGSRAASGGSLCRRNTSVCRSHRRA